MQQQHELHRCKMLVAKEGEGQSATTPDTTNGCVMTHGVTVPNGKACSSSTSVGEVGALKRNRSQHPNSEVTHASEDEPDCSAHRKPE